MLNVFTTNRFYVGLYADVFSICVEHRPSLLICFDEYYSKYVDSFMHIEIVDPDIDYDLFCTNNLKQEKHKTFACLLLKLTQNRVIPARYIINVVDKLSEYINEYIKLSNHAYIVDEMIEHISLVYSSTYLSEDNICFIKKITLYKPKQFPGLSARSIFKIMDIV